MDYRQFERQLGSSALLPVYSLVGPEAFFKREAIALLREKVLGDSDPQLCLLQFEGSEVGPIDVFDELRTRSFFGAAKLVIVHNAGPFLTGHGAALSAYLKKPSSKSVLVLEADKLDGRTSVAKALRDGVVECKRLYENRVPSWLAQRARSHGITLPRDAVMALAGQIGADLVQLDLQLEKLATLVGKGNQVTQEHVAQAVGYDKMVDIFKLTDAVSEGLAGLALETLHRLIEGGNAFGQVLATLAWRFRQLRRIRRLSDEGLKGQELARKANVNPYFLDELVRQARRFPVQGLLDKQRMLHRADVALKSRSEGDGGLRITERLVIELCR